MQVILVYGLLTLSRFHKFFQYFHPMLALSQQILVENIKKLLETGYKKNVICFSWKCSSSPRLIATSELKFCLSNKRYKKEAKLNHVIKSYTMRSIVFRLQLHFLIFLLSFEYTHILLESLEFEKMPLY